MTATPQPKAQPPRRIAQWLAAHFASGRTLPRRHVYGQVSGRIQAGLPEADWKFVVWLASVSGCTISDVIRDAVAAVRVDCEKDVFEPGDPLPWMAKP